MKALLLCFGLACFATQITASDSPALWIIGDSTVRNGTRGLQGWGDPLKDLFDPTKIRVENRALGGRSSRTFFTEGLWEKVRTELKPGDFVLMQFGHNDGGSLTQSRGRASLKGVDDRTEEITRTNGTKETVHTFGWYMRRYITDAKAKSATPIVCSLIPRNDWRDGRVLRGTNSYADFAREVARQEGVGFVDLHEIIARKYEAEGQEAVTRKYFLTEHTHTTPAGAALNAACVVEGLRALPDCKLVGFLKETPSKPDTRKEGNGASVETENSSSARGTPGRSTLIETEPRNNSNPPDSLESLRPGVPRAVTGSRRFDFRGGLVASGYTAVTTTNLYSPDAGFGFEPETVPVTGYGCVKNDTPFLYSVRLPEGNYRVSATFGSRSGNSTNTVKAELRRLMLENVTTEKGQEVTRAFTANVRTPQISSGDMVHLKPREKTDEFVNWDDRLTLEFNGSRPCLSALEITPVTVPTIFLLGDSTVCDQPREPWNSWGQMLPRFFKPEIAIANHAESGESIRSSLAARRFDKVFSQLQPGDWVLVQFGHNDMKDKLPDALATYKTNLKRIVTVTRANGATPVLITSMERKDGVEKDTLGGYPDAVREVAKAEGVALIDLHAASKVLYRALGRDLGKAFQDGTHHNNYGSYELARCVVEGIRKQVPALATFLANDVPVFDPAHPDLLERFQIPASPASSALRPEGN